MIFEDVTIQDCHREAWLESQITVAQRKINRLCKEISFKEEIAQRLMSPWFCEHYDNQIGRRYEEIAALEGGVRAAQLELDRLADKRYADKARRLAALALIEEVGKVGKNAMTGTTSASAPSSDPRQKQQAMYFGPGTPPAAPPKSASPSVTLDQKVEDDIARAFEICSREIPPPDPTPATATPSTPPPTPTSSDKSAVTPLKHSTLSRLAIPAADAEPDSVNRLEDSAADSFARADSSPHQGDSSSIDESAAPSNACDSADEESPIGMTVSAVPTDSQTAVRARSEARSSGGDEDENEPTDGDQADGMSEGNRDIKGAMA